jgi:hypothetical protein
LTAEEFQFDNTFEAHDGVDEFGLPIGIFDDVTSDEEE